MTFFCFLTFVATDGKLGQPFQVLMLSQQNIPKTLFWVALLKNISLDIHLVVYQEHFVHK